MKVSVIRQGQVWDVLASRKASETLFPVWLIRYDREARTQHKTLLCQVQNNGRFGWTVVVAGEVTGLRLVPGFKHQWQAIRYAISIRKDIEHPEV